MHKKGAKMHILVVFLGSLAAGYLAVDGALRTLGVLGDALQGDRA